MLNRRGMKTFSQPLADVAARVVRPLGRLLTLVAGLVMMIVGLAMMVTIVMLPIGTIIGLLGVAVFICAVFAPRSLTGS